MSYRAGAFAIVLLSTACVVQQQPDPQAPMAQAGPPGGAAATGARQLMFNGRAATAVDLDLVVQLERGMGHAIPDGAYWYDPTCGAAGMWSGPTLGFLPPGMALGGPLPANASGGGQGNLTGVFINGREIHPYDYQYLVNLLGQVQPGRYWVDAQGNAGLEGGPALVNLVQVARQRQARGGGNSYYRSDGTGNNVFVGGGCVAVNGTMGSGDSKSSYSYYGSGCE
jgi:hypothetical protein